MTALVKHGKQNRKEVGDDFICSLLMDSRLTLVMRASAMMVRSLKKIKVCSSTDALPAIWALRCLVFRLSVSACTPARSLADSGRGARPSEAASKRCTNTSAYL